MTEEEYFRKNYPDSCYGDRLLSPYWDFFQDGVEFGERQSEKKIEELKLELTKKADTNHSLVEQMAHLETENAELKEKREVLECDNYNANCNLNLITDQLTKATDLLIKMYYLYFDPCVTNKDLENRDKLFEEVKQFIKE